MWSASAAGKAILLGEHAVVYGRPAIAVPVSGVRAQVRVTPLAPGEGVRIVAEDLGCTFGLESDEPDERALPLQATVRNALDYFGCHAEGLALRIAIRSAIPVARGMGSGTAVATAIVRALAAFAGCDIAPQALSDLVYRTEVLLHGTPSGVDNTVVAFEQPVYFRRGVELAPQRVGAALSLLIADTGVPSRTRDSVAQVHQGWQSDPARYERLFGAIGALVEAARDAIAQGDIATLGELMSGNQRLLVELGVSSPELDRLVSAATAAGALGAKLSGGGQGGCMIALVTEATRASVQASLSASGAQAVYATVVC